MNIYRKAIKAYGLESQINVAVEEMAELTKELTKTLRGKKDVNHIAEEIADVEIMLEQLKEHFDIHSDVDIWRSKKLERLSDSLSRYTR